MNVKLNKNIKQMIDNLSLAAKKQKVAIYLVGGCVRDIILKRQSKDVDIVVEGNAAILAQALKRKDLKMTAHDKFGTLCIVAKDGARLDLATARKEIYLHSGALPVVSAGTIKEDLFRRDFSINALALNLSSKSLVDFYGGMKDIRQKNIRVMHGRSFVDDPTRILRAVRFEQRFGFKIEKHTLVSLKIAIKNAVENNVKPQRYFSEFRKIFNEPSPFKVLRRLNQLRALDFISPELDLSLNDLQRMERSIQELKKESFNENVDWAVVYLLGILKHLKRAETVRIVQKFGLTRHEKDVLMSFQSQSVLLNKKLRKNNLQPSEVYAALKKVPREIICFIRVTTSANIVRRYIDLFLKKLSFVSLDISGEDLIQVGFSAGEKLGSVLNNLLHKKLNGKLNTRRQQLLEAKKILSGN